MTRNIREIVGFPTLAMVCFSLGMKYRYEQRKKIFTNLMIEKYSNRKKILRYPAAKKN